MQISIQDQRFDIPEHIVLGICKVCGLPLVTGEIYDYLLQKVDDIILFYLVNGFEDAHEICIESPEVMAKIRHGTSSTSVIS